MKVITKLISGLFFSMLVLLSGLVGLENADAAPAGNKSISTTVAPATGAQDSTLSTARLYSERSKSVTVYKDSRWPTTNPQLLSIPESDRWYNARSKVGTYGTIAGPVRSVYQAKNSPGMPVFINIGNAYPNSNRAQIVIWAEQVPYCEETLHAIDHGGAWVSFTGPISLYNGVPEINLSDGYVEWTYWTNVR